MVSAVILTTMQVQDLKDQGSDIARGRWTTLLPHCLLGSFLAHRVFVLLVPGMAGMWVAAELRPSHGGECATEPYL